MTRVLEEWTRSVAVRAERRGGAERVRESTPGAVAVTARKVDGGECEEARAWTIDPPDGNCQVAWRRSAAGEPQVLPPEPTVITPEQYARSLVGRRAWHLWED